MRLTVVPGLLVAMLATACGDTEERSVVPLTRPTGSDEVVVQVMGRDPQAERHCVGGADLLSGAQRVDGPLLSRHGRAPAGDLETAGGLAGVVAAAGQDAEGLVVSASRPVDKLRLHGSLRSRATDLAA